MLSRHALGDCLGNGFQVFADWAGPRLFNILVSAVAWAGECFPDMILGMFWATVSRCRLTRPGHVLSMFWPLGSVGQGLLFRHSFGDGLGDFLQAPGDIDLDPWELHFGDCFGDPWDHYGPLGASFCRWF